MDEEILVKSVSVGEGESVFLDYYIIREHISREYCNLKTYGIKVERTRMPHGGGKVVDIKQINNVFYRENDIEEFVKAAAKMRIEPLELGEFTDKYVCATLDRVRRKI